MPWILAAAFNSVVIILVLFCAVRGNPDLLVFPKKRIVLAGIMMLGVIIIWQFHPVFPSTDREPMQPQALILSTLHFGLFLIAFSIFDEPDPDPPRS
jgi:hypothetical protein